MPYRRTCSHCGIDYDDPHPNTRHCSIECRFMEKVDKTPGNGPDGDCWIWTGARHGKGYGHFKIGDFVEKAQRFAFRHFCKHEPGNLLVCHSCDNPPCVNPAHLFLATNAANLLDRQRKRRHAHGESHMKARLTEAQVLTIRRGGRQNVQELARVYGVSPGSIRAAGLGHSWRHLDGIAEPWGQNAYPRHRRG